uniref:Uncharacterized protein n=1 Tax=Podoviridae sp. ctf5T2 TaxID=2827743 RepID=A0A8S5SLH9_9CAUD|nr:MAG TPA: hypothetical protein [Podoviridae sp. ctf5T2]
MKGILAAVDGILLALLFITGFSLALAIVLWLVGILDVTIWAVAKTLLAVVINVVLIFLVEELMNKLNRDKEW